MGNMEWFDFGFGVFVGVFLTALILGTIWYTDNLNNLQKTGDLFCQQSGGSVFEKQTGYNENIFGLCEKDGVALKFRCKDAYNCVWVK